MFKNKNDYEQLKLVDYGLSCYVKEENKVYKKCGTPGYIAPEVLQYHVNIYYKLIICLFQKGEKFYDESCDIFSLGVIFYLLITGIQPFNDKDQKNIFIRNKQCNINYDNLQNF